MKKNLEFRIQNSELNRRLTTFSSLRSGLHRRSSHERGFTLVELLASIIVLVVVGTIISGITTSTLRGTNKASNIEIIRQNGNYALAQVSKTLQYAQVFNGLSNNGIDYSKNCPDSFAPTPTPVVKYNYIKVTSNSIPLVYNCTSSPPSFKKDGVSVVNTNAVTLTECSITCIQAKSSDVPIIGISFTIGPKNPSTLVENSTPPILFETSVTLRNYKK